MATTSIAEIAPVLCLSSVSVNAMTRCWTAGLSTHPALDICNDRIQERRHHERFHIPGCDSGRLLTYPRGMWLHDTLTLPLQRLFHYSKSSIDRHMSLGSRRSALLATLVWNSQ